MSMGSCISNNIQNTDIDTNIRKSNIPPVINLPIFDKKTQLDSKIVRRLNKIVEEDIDTNIRKSNIPPVINLPIFDKKTQLDSKIVRRLTTVIEEDTVSISDLSSSS